MSDKKMSTIDENKIQKFLCNKSKDKLKDLMDSAGFSQLDKDTVMRLPIDIPGMFDIVNTIILEKIEKKEKKDKKEKKENMTKTIQSPKKKVNRRINTKYKIPISENPMTIGWDFDMKDEDDIKPPMLKRQLSGKVINTSNHYKWASTFKKSLSNVTNSMDNLKY